MSEKLRRKNEENEREKKEERTGRIFMTDRIREDWLRVP
jgi:hypothetical protein